MDFPLKIFNDYITNALFNVQLYSKILVCSENSKAKLVFCKGYKKILTHYCQFRIHFNLPIPFDIC